MQRQMPTVMIEISAMLGPAQNPLKATSIGSLPVQAAQRLEKILGSGSAKEDEDELPHKDFYSYLAGKLGRPGKPDAPEVMATLAKGFAETAADLAVLAGADWGATRQVMLAVTAGILNYIASYDSVVPTLPYGTF